MYVVVFPQSPFIFNHKRHPRGKVYPHNCFAIIGDKTNYCLHVSHDSNLIEREGKYYRRHQGLFSVVHTETALLLKLVHVLLLLFHSHRSRCSSSWKLIHWSNLLPKVASSMPALHILVLEYTRLHLIQMRFLKLYSYIPICVHQIRPLDAASGTS